MAGPYLCVCANDKLCEFLGHLMTSCAISLLGHDCVLLYLHTYTSSSIYVSVLRIRVRAAR